MKTFMRSILIGVCILSGYGLVEASDQVVVDTIDKCLETGSRIYMDVVDAEFQEFLRKDRDLVKKHGGTNILYEIDYDALRPEFSGEGLDDKDSPTAMMGIGTVTMDLRTQYINCTIPYIRTIRFHNVDLRDYDTEKGINEKELVGEELTGEYPDFVLKSKREWHAVIRIGKRGMLLPRLKISGDTCLDNTVTLSVPEDFQDMKFEWFCSGNKISNANSRQISLLKNSIPSNSLTTMVHCNVEMCTGKILRDSIRIRLKQTPISTLTVSDCVPVSSKLTSTSIRVTASNERPYVKFDWNGNTSIYPYGGSTMSSETVNYTIPGSDDFTIKVTTSGGCKPSTTTRVVHRKLTDAVVLQVSDACPTTGTPFTIATEPPLPNMNLQWTISNDLQTIVPPTGKKRNDQITINKRVTSNNLSTVTVAENICKSSLSKTISVSEAFTKMVVKDEDGNTLQSGATVKAGSTITFTAPKHSSITGANPYTWSISTMRGDFANMITGKGGAERTLTAPSAGESISVTVSYESCRGKESESYTFYSTASGN